MAAATPEVFEPQVISGPEHDSAPAFTPDGETVYFSRSDSGTSTIMVSRRRSDRWSEPKVAEFSGIWSDMEPAMSPGGTFLVFVSNRPTTSGGRVLDGAFNGKAFPAGGGNLWRVAATAGGWDAPVRLPDTVNASASTFAPSIAGDGSLYFMRPATGAGPFRLFRAQLKDGKYEAPQPLPFSDGNTADVDPAVAPDESFLVFGSRRSPAQGMDLFIVFRRAGSWGTPIHLGTRVNSPGSDAEARLGPDHETLYFSSDRQTAGGAATRPAWDNGKYNIWRAPLAGWLAGAVGPK